MFCICLPKQISHETGKEKKAVSAKTHTNRFSLETEGPSEELLGRGGTGNEITCCTPAPVSSAPAQPWPGRIPARGQGAATVKWAPEEAAGGHEGTGRT